ncbi:MAG: single-stranded-DNA-specific exonuclease RecJ [Pyrinomonadaceae bacterium]
MAKVWSVQKHDHEAVRSMSASLGIKPVVAAILIARGYSDDVSARKFLNPCIDDLHDPALLKGMPEAIARICTAIDAGEKILIWGDYDVDGTTGTVLLRKTLKALGGVTDFHIPNRFTEGYGINIPTLEAAKANGCSLAISVDCGIRSFEPAQWAAENGLDLIITDHHLSDPIRGNPRAVAIVNPNQTGCTYPDKNLAGVGVAYKLAHALLRERGREDLLRPFLKIAAIGTVADVMQLSGENRSIVALGLKDLTVTSNFGLKALMEVADCHSEMTSYHIGFRIAPRINAAGRMDIARHVVELFETENFHEARKLAGVLDSRNRERQGVQQQITDLALLEAAERGPGNFIVVAGEGWHRGVIGLAASRIAERLNRPTIVLSIENGFAHGSARSIADFHLVNALDSCAELFDQYGGHAAAAGMKLPTENIDELRRRLDIFAGEILTEERLDRKLHIDALLTSQSIELALLHDLAALEPFGAGNPTPVFTTRGLTIRFEPKVMKDKHLKLYLADETGRAFEAVWWGGVEHSIGQTLGVGSSIEVAYTLEANSWQGNTRLQLVVQDLRADTNNSGRN